MCVLLYRPLTISRELVDMAKDLVFHVSMSIFILEMECSRNQVDLLYLGLWPINFNHVGPRSLNPYPYLEKPTE